MSTLGIDQKERLTRQKQLLNKRLGLDVAGGLGLQSEELFKEEDLLVAQPAYQADMDRQQVGLSVSAYLSLPNLQSSSSSPR